MENKYTSLEISRLIQSKVPEVETELWYPFSMSSVRQKKKLYTTTKRSSLYKEVCSFSPAYRLDDVLRAIKVLGEKQGKMGVCSDCGAENIKRCACYKDVGVENWDVWHSHRLLTAYLADNGFGERTERVIRDIF